MIPWIVNTYNSTQYNRRNKNKINTSDVLKMDIEWLSGQKEWLLYLSLVICHTYRGNAATKSIRRDDGQPAIAKSEGVKSFSVQNYNFIVLIQFSVRYGLIGVVCSIIVGNCSIVSSIKVRVFFFKLFYTWFSIYMRDLQKSN